MPSTSAGWLGPENYWKQIFPLKDVGDGFYRCRNGDRSGDVYSLLVVLDHSQAEQPRIPAPKKR